MRLELLPRADITRAVAAAFGHVRDRLVQLPARLAAPLARASDPVDARARLSDAVNAVLIELSETRVVAISEESTDAN